MPVKMYDLMWKRLRPFIELPATIDRRPEVSLMHAVILSIIDDIEEKYTFISQPEAIKMFHTSKKTLAHLRDDWGMPYVSKGIGSSERFFYKEEEVRTHLEELRSFLGK